MINVKNQDEKASYAQKNLISQAVRYGKIHRIPDKEWQNLTKGQAANLIDSNGLAEQDSFATYTQRKIIGRAVKAGVLQRFSVEEWDQLTRQKADKIIQEHNLVDNDPATEKQKQKLTELVTAGFLNRFPNTIYKRMSHQEASKFISMGLARQQRGEKALPYAQSVMKPTMPPITDTSAVEDDCDEIPF